MPICKREGFENAPSSNRDETFHDNEDVFYCEVTKEIFRNYDDYFRHVMVINSTVWQCEATGRDNLTYAEALKSEQRARKKMELFKQELRAPVMLVIDHAKQSSLNTLCTLASKFLRKRYFLNEEVSAFFKSTSYNVYKVMEIIPPGKTISPTMVYEETENLKYKLQRVGQVKAEVIVPFENIRRQRFEFTTENLQMFIKNNVIRVDGILRPKPESFKKYISDAKITFASLFIGKMPHFTPPKIKQDHNKRQSTINNYLVKNGDEKQAKLNAEELAKREKERVEKAEAKAKALGEEMERLRREKQERLLEQERQKAEKRRKLIERIEDECNFLLTKTDDLERTDHRLLPTYTPIQTYIPDKLLGDAFMLREFMHSFAGLLSGIEVFRGNLNFLEMSRALTMREVAGPLSDILLVFLGTIFDLQKEEEEECMVEYLLMRKEMLRSEPFITMSQAGRAHFFSKRHFSMRMNELPLDALTLTEVLRLHLLGSGANVKDRAKNWRLVYRNGYTSGEDPGLALRMQHPHILRALHMYTVYQLPFRDILRILRCLMAQILTYSNPLNLMDERMEEMAKARMTLRGLNSAENIRQTGVQTQKRVLTNEFHQECIEKDTKSDPEKRVQLEEKLNKKIAELLAQSEREHRKYEQELRKLNESLFNFLVYLGMDRAYRKYYVLESMPGIFVEHPRDCMDTCLSEPPMNAGPGKLNPNELPKTRKELRSYLMRLFTEEEKKALLLEKAGAATIKITASQENKENQVIQENHVVNGLCNGYEPSKTHNAEQQPQPLTNGESTSQESTATTVVAVAAPPPTQYELYMCTGDRHNCIVHDERNRDRQHWAYLYKKEDVEALIDALNPLGERESHLREQLIVLRELILNHVRKCPIEMLSLDVKQHGRFKTMMLSDTSRKYNESNFGYEQDSDLTTVMHGVLIDRILQFENDIYSGHLGRLKVEDMKKWRENLESDAYDAQCVLQWGPSSQKCSTLVTADGVDEDVSDDTEDDDDVEVKNGGMYANKPYIDPGEDLGNTLEIDSEDSDEDEISLHDSPTIRTSVRNLASALLQVEQAIEKRFLKEPFGAPLKEMKNKELLDRKIKSGIEHLKQWEVSLMECTSYSQVFLHLNILNDAIVWARSTNKSVCMVCRRGSDPEKMLLCDECNGGTHMFCMKPKMKTVPEGNWYCQRCVKRMDGEKGDTLKKKNERRASRRRRMQSDEIEHILETEDIESVVNVAESDEELVDVEVETEYAAAEEDEDEEEDAKNQNGHEEKSDTTSTQNEDELACNVCSYDGCEVVCVRCKGGFHLECIKLKRTPRYIFVCSDCKSKEESRKRRTKDSDDDDDDADISTSRSKRLRVQRNSLRNSMPGDATPEHRRSSNHRRSNRRTGDHLPLNSSALYRLLEDIMKHEDAWPFLRPVMQSEVPDYYKIIKHPMDFAKVKSKLNMGDYQLNEEVMNDVQLIFANCDKYNVKGNEVYQAGYELERFVIDRCKELHLPFKPSDMND